MDFPSVIENRANLLVQYDNALAAVFVSGIIRAVVQNVR